MIYNYRNDYFILGCNSKHKICTACFARQVSTSGCDNKIACPYCCEKSRKYTIFQMKQNHQTIPRYEQTVLEIVEAASKLDATRFYCEQHYKPGFFSIFMSSRVVDSFCRRGNHNHIHQQR